MVLVGFLGTVVELFKKSHRISSNTRPGLPEVSKRSLNAFPQQKPLKKRRTTYAALRSLPVLFRTKHSMTNQNYFSSMRLKAHQGRA